MSTLMKIGFGTHAIVMTEGVVAAMDPSITLFPHSIERPFVHDWSVVEERGQKLIEMELHWPSTPRGAA